MSSQYVTQHLDILTTFPSVSSSCPLNLCHDVRNMCYRVVSHTLRCDTRPVLSDGENLLIDPYGPPRRCRCRTDRHMRPQYRCSDHGCCYISSRRYTCPANCRTSTLYHVYIQRNTNPGVHFHRSTREPEWRDLPIFDGNIFPIASTSASESGRHSREGGHTCPSESVEFRLARDQILEVGRILDHGLQEIDKARFEEQRLTHRHYEEHGSRCGRYSRTRDCTWRERIRNSQEHGDNIQTAVQGFRQLWRRWKVYLRNLERGGDRRLSGLEEWRRRGGLASEKEEYDHLMGLYREDIRVDEKDARAARERKRAMDKQSERYRADQMRYVPPRHDRRGDHREYDRGRYERDGCEGREKRSEDLGRSSRRDYREYRMYGESHR